MGFQELTLVILTHEMKTVFVRLTEASAELPEQVQFLVAIPGSSANEHSWRDSACGFCSCSSTRPTASGTR